MVLRAILLRVRRDLCRCIKQHPSHSYSRESKQQSAHYEFCPRDTHWNYDAPDSSELGELCPIVSTGTKANATIDPAQIAMLTAAVRVRLNG